MTRTEHLLTILAEECMEVAQRATKALRFGLKEIQPGQEQDNAFRIVDEYAHLVASIDMLECERELTRPMDFAERVMAKARQVEKLSGLLERMRDAKMKLTLLLAFSLAALSSCSRAPLADAPLPSIAHPACIDMDLKLDGKMQALQTDAQDLFTIQGAVAGDPVTAHVTLCYKGRQ